MDPPPALSVVVPTHDTRELTLRCLAALDAADPPPLEVIVVDDGSVDGTAEAVAASYPAVRMLRHAGVRGFTAAANAGLAAARGDALLLLNSDTEVSPGAPGALARALAADPGLGIAGATLVYPDGTPQWSGGWAPDTPWLLALSSGFARALGALYVGPTNPWRRLRPVSGHGPPYRPPATEGIDAGAPAGVRPVDWVTGAALAIRRAAWEAAGPLDERFAVYCQDLDLCLRAREHGWRAGVVPAARVLHHHGATLSSVAGVGSAGYHAPALWGDLVRLAAKRGGPSAAARTARTLRLGGWLRRALLLPVLASGAGRRRRAAAERGALLAAAAAAREAARAADGSTRRDSLSQA